MIKSILFKEWLKTYKIILSFLFIFLLVIVETFLDTKNNFEFQDATVTIVNIIILGKFDFNYINIISMTFSVLLATMQFYPEIHNGRIRLYLHLPLNHNKLIFLMLFSGLSTIIIVHLLFTIGYFFILNTYYPIEVFFAICSKLIPIFISSILLYLATALVFVEPKSMKKISYIVITILLLMIYLNISIKKYSISYELNFFVLIVICTYIVATFEAFASYKKGYIK